MKWIKIIWSKLHVIWKIIVIISTFGGFVGFIWMIIPQKDYAKINYEYLKNFESINIPDKTVYDLFYNISIENNEKVGSEIWNKYASAILNIYEQIEPNSSIVINDSLKGNITNKKRRIDLSIRQKIAGQELLLAFKLYPWKSKIEKSELYSFKYLLDDIKASKGIIIINQEIDTSIINFAQKNLISLCNLKDTDAKHWNDEIKIPVYWIQIIPKFNFTPTVYFEGGDKLHKDFSKAQFSYNYGKDVFTLIDYLDYKWQSNELPHTTDSLHIFYLSSENLKMKVNKNDWRDVSKFEVYYTTEENYWLKYFEPEKYKAIENYITHDIVFSEIDLSVKMFKVEESDEWIKLDKKDVDVNKLKGLNLFITANYSQLTREEMNIDGLNIQKVE